MSIKIPEKTKEIFTQEEMKKRWYRYTDARQDFEQRYNLFCGMTTSFQEQLELVMKVEGMTFEKLAEKIGVSPKTIVRYNGGHYAPSMQMLVAICISLNLDTKQSTALLASLGRCFQSTRKEDYAYMYLIENHRGKTIEQCNSILKDLGIDERFWLYPRTRPKDKET